MKVCHTCSLGKRSGADRIGNEPNARQSYGRYLGGGKTSACGIRSRDSEREGGGVSFWTIHASSVIPMQEHPVTMDSSSLQALRIKRERQPGWISRSSFKVCERQIARSKL